MKKVICLILAVLMLLGMAACGASEGGAAAGDAAAATTAGGGGQFMAGFGKANITPEGSVPMGGYGKELDRMSKGVLSYLWVTCIAITDEYGETVLLYGIDMIGSGTAKKQSSVISKATGVPEENIVFSASHTHSCPEVSHTEIPAVAEFLAIYKEGLLTAAQDALADRKPATMERASAETKGANFVRRYIMEDGSYAGSNYGDHSLKFVAYESEVDNVIQLLKFVRDGRDIIVANFQTHPHKTGGMEKYDISADIVGEFRDCMSAALDCDVVYFTGASGNINPYSFIKGDTIYDTYKDHGKAMADAALTCEGNYIPVATGKVQVIQQEFTATVNHENDQYAEICKELRKLWDDGKITTAELIKRGEAAGIKLSSAYHAGAIASRPSAGATGTFTIGAIAIGDAGFVWAPYEMYDTNGMFIKENSPFDITIVATCANGANGYFPSLLGFEHGGYEPDTTKYIPGTAEELADTYVELLTQLHGTK